MAEARNKNLIKAYRFSIIAICIFYALYIACVPMQLTVSADIRFDGSLLPQTINFFGKVFEVCGIGVCYAISAYAVYRRGRKGVGTGYIICGVSALLKCTASAIAYWIVDGGIPSFNNGLLGEAFLSILLPTMLEIVQFTVYFLISALLILRLRRIYDEAYAATKGGCPEMDKWVFPFKRIFDLKNPMLAACFTGSLTICATKLALRLIEEFYMAFIGLPIETLEDFLISLAGFASDAACGVLAYTVMVFVIIKALEFAAGSAKASAAK